MPKFSHTVSAGEDIHTLAADYGFADTKVIWDDPDNEALRARRPNASLLAAGDQVVVPERKIVAKSIKEQKLNAFEVATPMRPVTTVLRSEEAPLASEPFRVEYTKRDGTLGVVEGTTTADGSAEYELPGYVRRARFVPVSSNGWEIVLGGLDPLRMAPDGGESGVRQRLRALGFASVQGDSASLGASVRAFRRVAGLPDGESIDDEVFSALESRYGQ